MILANLLFKNRTLFFKYKEKHDKIKNTQRNPLSCLIIIIGPLGGLFCFQTNGAKMEMTQNVGTTTIATDEYVILCRRISFCGIQCKIRGCQN